MKDETMYSKKHSKKYLKGLLTYRVQPKVELEAIERILSSLDCARSLAIWILFREKEHGQLLDLEFVPDQYENADSMRRAYFATKLLSKFKGLTLEFDKEQVALDKFQEYELICRRTNYRFSLPGVDPLYKGKAVWLHNAVIRKISDILGDLDVEEFFSLPDWGPGASTKIKKVEACAANKFQNESGITRSLFALLPTDFIEKIYPLWGQHLRSLGYPSFEVGNRVTTVDKDAKTDRVIAIEPGMNLFFQKSLGLMIRKRLISCGIDLRWQSRNQRLAKKASLTGGLATVDMSSASDSISKKVVEVLLPPRWYTLLDVCRSPAGVLNGKAFEWEKFSSMGNGFTFELESLIFYAVAKACVEYLKPDIKTVSVYGDDVIIPSSCFELFAEMMTFYGFTVNLKKSHYNGFFRESCGAHHFLGFDLKPIYLKDKLSNIQSVYRLGNAIRRLAHRTMGNYGCDARYRNAFDFLVSKVPEALRLRIPETLGDGGFISNLDEACPVLARDLRTTDKVVTKYKGINHPGRWSTQSKVFDNPWNEGFMVSHLQEVAKSLPFDGVGLSLAQLWAMSKHQTSELLGEFDERPRYHREVKYGTSTVLQAIERLIPMLDKAPIRENRVEIKLTKSKLVNSTVSQWYDLGPWVNTL